MRLSANYAGAFITNGHCVASASLVSRVCRLMASELCGALLRMRALEDPRYTVIAANSLLMKPVTQPDALGHWGRYGGRFVPETLMAPLEELTAAFEAARAGESFQKELGSLLRDYPGPP